MNNINKSVIDLADRVWKDCSRNGQPIENPVCLEKWIPRILDENLDDFIAYNLIFYSEFYNYSLLLRIENIWATFNQKNLEQVFTICGTGYSSLYAASRFFAGVFHVDTISFLEGATYIQTDIRESVIDSMIGRVLFFTELDWSVIRNSKIDMSKYEAIGVKLGKEGVPLLDSPGRATS